MAMGGYQIALGRTPGSLNELPDKVMSTEVLYYSNIVTSTI